MAASTIFFIGVFTAALLTLFVYETIRELRKAGQPTAIRPAQSASAAPRALAPVPATPRHMRLLVATDGSPCSDAVLQSVARRPWPPDTEVEVVTVVHTHVPYVPEPTLVGAAMHETALEQDRDLAPGRVRDAEQMLAGLPGIVVSGVVLEGDPEKAVLDEAERWNADIVMVGSHGFGPFKRMVLGSVSQGIAAHAPCSVEIVRCRHADA